MSQKFYDLLFEVSNENRHQMLKLLESEALRVSDITRKMDMTRTETRRHISRLQDAGLINRDIEGLYKITQYGTTALILLSEFEFISEYRDYINSHSFTETPREYLKQIGALGDSQEIKNPMEYLLHAEKLFEEAKEYVWILNNQFPLHFLSTINKILERRVNLRIIESKDRKINPNFTSLTLEEPSLINHKQRDLVEQKLHENITLNLYISDKRMILSFPRLDGQYDFNGIIASNEDSLNWGKKIFMRYWMESKRVIPKIDTLRDEQRIRTKQDNKKSIEVSGKNDPRTDYQAVQNAVNNYEEVLLSGIFNFGDSEIQLSKSVTIRGKGRENNVPLTRLYKQGWSFPFRRWTSFFSLNEDGIDVVIENLYFFDFNCSAIRTGAGMGSRPKPNSIKVLNNRITLLQGYGRGLTLGSIGDIIHGVQVEGIGGGGVLIDGNFIDFATGTDMVRGVISRGGLEDDPEYRPDLRNHEYFASIGIGIYSCSGKIIIQNNIIRNASGRGITSVGHYEASELFIRNNEIKSEVFGSYPFSSHDSSSGILIQSSFGEKNATGFHVHITDNLISLDKVNQCGIVILGPSEEGSLKFKQGTIRDNIIHLKNGYEGIHIRKCDEFQVFGNRLLGEVYYGIRVSGSPVFGEFDMASLRNTLFENDVKDLKIKSPDNYSNNHIDDRIFTGSNNVAKTAHYWLNEYSSKNIVKILESDTIIDKGKSNILTITNR